ncbi:Holliday junction endonuclease [Neosynechococcus sphagnicola]|uniref:Holliday junction endonuclease n=1 Tax=Neosynechococcus sphagnicola TaxID=1501145 RepID=UPI001EF9D371|nr:Holliday junction endonuclease [Neosynechococcus sphagnicola]
MTQSPALIAIDPGLSGAISILHSGTLTAHPRPLAGKELVLGAIAQLIRSANPSLAVLEKVHSMPGQGVSSTFKFGTGYGSILGILVVLGIRTELVPPQTWKRVVLQGTTKDKDAAISYCRRAFPNVALVLPRCRKPHDGIADALCLLEYGRRHLFAERSASN